nr:pogo transposable element with ZNF domain [Nothobranchius furzeri]XP_015828896.2 pogo transposable element with ZNF domain [Nothobranchius furzeri]
MECVEQEQEVPASPERHEAIMEKPNIVFWNIFDLKEEDTGPSKLPEARIIPIPNQEMTNGMPPTSTKTAFDYFAVPTLGFKVNGRLASLKPGGDVAQFKLRCNPGGSASGFTTIQIPATVTLHSSEGVSTKAFQSDGATSFIKTPKFVPKPSPEPIPVITGVVSGEAATKVLNDHYVNFKSGFVSPAEESKSKEAQPKPETNSISEKKLMAPEKLLRKGEIEPIAPPNCSVCSSPYKLITQLRGFMCRCCSGVALGLANLKKQRIKEQRKKRMKIKLKKMEVPDLSHTVPSPKPQPVAVKFTSPPRKIRRFSDDFLSDEFSCPSSPGDDSLVKLEGFVPQYDIPQGKLVVLVDDFYYGKAAGTASNSLLNKKFSGPFRCIYCSKMLCNNIKFMDHVQQHVSSMSERDEKKDSSSVCPHCFRRFPSSFRLQCHLEVHRQHESTVMCKICELAFDSQPALLCHMRSMHKPGEMPYVCQVCNFRTSFYSDLWSHFREAHVDTRTLLCPYCLRILRSSACYLQHVVHHQKKQMITCSKCRLHFLYVKERAHHREQHHNTYVTPPQLSGLKAGTKVTVRSYSAVGSSETEEGQKRTFVPCKVVEVTAPPPRDSDPVKKPFESLGSLLSGLTPHRDFNPSQRCVECLTDVPDVKTHFPSLIHCSICRFSTCCSSTYANHMINNHTTRNASLFPDVFLFDPRLSETLNCKSCTFSTNRGDAMANHLTERPDHVCSMIEDKAKDVVDRPASDPVSGGGFKPVQDYNSDSKETNNENGAFVPIQLNWPRPISTQLKVKPLKSASSSFFKPAMTITFLKSDKPSASWSLVHLSIVLSSLCHGIHVVSRRCRLAPKAIRALITLQHRSLMQKTWSWNTDKMAEWVLSRREQQLSVTEYVLLTTARKTLGENTSMEECYSWTIDFMLRHDLGLQTTTNNKLENIQADKRMFVRSLHKKIQGGALPYHCLGCMDELPVFINTNLFLRQNAEAFQLFSSPDIRPKFDIIVSALSNGIFLPPLLFFTGTVSAIPDEFPDNVLLEARNEGFTDEERLKIWIDKVWRPHVTSKHNHESLLVVDVHRGHLTETFKERLADTNTDLAFIPQGSSRQLQPLEICVTQVLRDFLLVRWNQLVSDGGLDGLMMDQLALTLACWFSEVSSTLKSRREILRGSFSLACGTKQGNRQEESAGMITALTKALSQPPDTGGPKQELEQEPAPEPVARVKVMGDFEN